MMRIGAIGAGMVSRHHQIAWAKLRPDVKVVAIADPIADNAARRAAEFDIPRTYTSAEAMLDGEQLDAIDIAAPREHHAALVRLGVARGLAVLCQKPLAPTLAEAEALVADTAGARLMVHENWRFRRYYRDAASWLANGTIGAVQQCQITLLTSGLLPDAQGARPALVRQPFFLREKRLLVNEVLIHHLDTLRVLLGPLQVTAARLGRSCADMAGEDNAVIFLRAASGAAVVLLGNLARPWLSRNPGGRDAGARRCRHHPAARQPAGTVRCRTGSAGLRFGGMLPGVIRRHDRALRRCPAHRRAVRNDTGR